MPAPTVDQSFVTQYETEVKAAYQREGSLLGNTVRTKKGVKGNIARFQKWGKMTTSEKTRQGDLAIDNPDHSYVDVTLKDKYSNYLVDSLDELKTNNDERAMAAQGSAWAIGRDSDGFIITAASATSNVVGDFSGGVTLNLILQALEGMDGKDVPQKGRFGVLAPHPFNELKALAKVSSRDYVGDLFPWLNGSEAFMWNGVMWMKFTGLVTTSSQATSYIWQQQAIGLASGLDVTTEMNYVPMKRSWLISSALSQQAAIIDVDGVYQLKTKNDTVIS
jgi:hypothetical protein